MMVSRDWASTIGHENDNSLDDSTDFVLIKVLNFSWILDRLGISISIRSEDNTLKKNEIDVVKTVIASC